MMRMRPADDSKTLILPGLNGSGEGHWQWHWARDKEDAVFVEQDNWTCPDLSHWRSRLEAVLECSDDVWIVAHSLGCILTANIATSPLANRIRGALLVAPCDLVATEKLHPCVLNFGDMPLSPLPFPSLVVASLDDPYMTFSKVKTVASSWQSALIDIGEAGHINIKSGFGRWTGGYELLSLLKTAARHRAAQDQIVSENRFADVRGVAAH